MGKFASNTKVSVERSKAEVEGLVEKYGANQFFSGWADGAAVIGFRMKDRFIRFRLPMPTDEECKNASVQLNSIKLARERKTMQRWRALTLVIKAKLEAVESGISEFEDEFLGHIVMPNGQTMSEWARPQLEEMYLSGKMPANILSLPSGGGR
jgi:hypothetical protein